MKLAELGADIQKIASKGIYSQSDLKEWKKLLDEYDSVKAKLKEYDTKEENSQISAFITSIGN